MAAKKRAKKSTKRPATKRKAAKRPAKKSAAARGGGKGLRAKKTPSAALATVIGGGSISRLDATKKIWSYIRSHKLQNPANKRNIKPDQKLGKVFGAREFSMFKMAAGLGKHLK